MGEILGAALSLIWLLTAVVFVLILLVVACLHFPAQTKLLTVCMGASTLAQFHAMGNGSVLRSQEENDLHAIGFFLHKVIFFALIVVGLKAGFALPGVVMAHFIPNLFQWGFYRWLVATALRASPDALGRGDVEVPARAFCARWRARPFCDFFRNRSTFSC